MLQAVLLPLYIWAPAGPRAARAQNFNTDSFFQGKPGHLSAFLTLCQARCLYFFTKPQKEDDMEFEELYQIAKNTLNPRSLTEDASAGSVAAAILTEAGNVYRGVCIDVPCSIGFCAEHAAIAAMVTAGVAHIVKMVAVYQDGSIIPPCGRCREFICQIHPLNHLCQVLLSNRVALMDELLPERC